MSGRVIQFQPLLRRGFVAAPLSQWTSHGIVASIAVCQETKRTTWPGLPTVRIRQPSVHNHRVRTKCQDTDFAHLALPPFSSTVLEILLELQYLFDDLCTDCVRIALLRSSLSSAR